MSPELLTLTGIILSGVFSFAAAYLVFRIQSRRVGPQNRKDDVEAAQVALEIAEKATMRQLALEDQISELTQILKSTHYKVTVVFSLGETPKVEMASIEAVKKPYHPPYSVT
jgi:hypothetical protein